VLAEAGLLKGQEATTHWAYCDVLARDYEGIDVQAQRALVVAGEGGRLVMAGGGTSWLDLAIYLIARFTGVDEAMRIARLNLIDWHSIGQQPYACLARTRTLLEDIVMPDFSKEALELQSSLLALNYVNVGKDCWIQHSRLEFIDELGSGAAGEVFRGTWARVHARAHRCRHGCAHRHVHARQVCTRPTTASMSMWP